VLYALNENTRSGVRVGDKQFVGYPLEGDAGLHLCLFALGFDQDPNVPIRVWAEDAAGNTAEVPFFCKTFPQAFRHRNIDINDRFISSVVPPILEEAGEPARADLDSFLKVNREFRVRDNSRISEITSAESPKLLWSEPFLQLSNSQVEAVFADYRTYMYNGQQVDEQVHLGFDLASLANSAVEASNRGRVAFAGPLGIYGNAVIVDHGLGLFSLYGHLSSIAVEKDQVVERGTSLGRTGRTGLAGGDHLHFSIIMQGVQVNPVEWWDPAWVKNHVLSKLE